MKTHLKRILNFYRLNCRNCNEPMNIADNNKKNQIYVKIMKKKKREIFLSKEKKQRERLMNMQCDREDL